jgi:hypothetical protein
MKRLPFTADGHKAATFYIPIVGIIIDDISPAILFFYEHITNCCRKRKAANHSVFSMAASVNSTPKTAVAG